MKKIIIFIIGFCLFVTKQACAIEIINPDMEKIKIPHAVAHSSKPSSILYSPKFKKYYIANGGRGVVQDGRSPPYSTSELNIYSSDGQYIKSLVPGFNMRNIYMLNDEINISTYNSSAQAGFMPNSGEYQFNLDSDGLSVLESKDVYGVKSSLGDPSAQVVCIIKNECWTKQPRSNKIIVVDMATDKVLKTIELDLAEAGVDILSLSDTWVGYTGVVGYEIVIPSIDDKKVLFFSNDGKYRGFSKLPDYIKLRSENHFNGFGYTNGLMFVFDFSKTEYGTFYGFEVLR